MHNHTKVTLRLALLAFALTPAMAIAADFSGAWMRDSARSTPAPYPNYWITRNTPPAFNPNTTFVMRVQQTAASMQVADRIHPQRTYVLDGEGHSSITDSGLGQITTTAAMIGDTLTIATVQPYGGMPGNVTLRASETWALSADGKELTVTTLREMPATKQSYTEVFKRQ